MEIQGYFTKKGLNLSAKLSAGASLIITQVMAGSGTLTNVSAAVSLPQIRQKLAVNTPVQSENTAIIPATLVAAEAGEDYDLTELGVYASDPNVGEILYKVYKLDAPIHIAAGSRMVLRFYLEETVSEEVDVKVPCSPAGVITESEFNPVQERVQGAAVSSRSVTVSASDLPAYLKALPRLITEQLTIHTSGTVTERLDLTGFYGSGRINITADTLGNCTVTDLVNAKDCSVPVMFSKLAFVDSGKADATYYHAVVCGENMKNLTMDTCTFTGDGTGKAFISVGGHGRLYNCTITGFAAAVSAFTYAIVGIDGATASDNSIGAHVYWGGIMILCAGTPKLLGGASNQNSGGIIFHNGSIV